MKILLTAFEAFGGDAVNPAREAVELVRDEVAGARVVKLLVPVVFHKAIDIVYAAMRAEQPDVTLGVGQAGGRCGITPERVAINVDDGRIPDNEGNQPVDVPVFADGPPAFFATVPVKAMVRYIRAAGVPASLSNSAGTYVCNHLMYGVLYHIAKSFPGMRGGFIHVPYLHRQAAAATAPSLSAEDIAKGLEAAITATVEHVNDLAVSEGAEH